MRRFLPLLIGVIVTPLAGCTQKVEVVEKPDKREICAQFTVGGVSEQEAYMDLGIKMRMLEGDSPSTLYVLRKRIERFCDYYK